MFQQVPALYGGVSLVFPWRGVGWGVCLVLPLPSLHWHMHRWMLIFSAGVSLYWIWPRLLPRLSLPSGFCTRAGQWLAPLCGSYVLALPAGPLRQPVSLCARGSGVYEEWLGCLSGAGVAWCPPCPFAACWRTAGLTFFRPVVVCAGGPSVAWGGRGLVRFFRPHNGCPRCREGLRGGLLRRGPGMQV